MRSVVGFSAVKGAQNIRIEVPKMAYLENTMGILLPTHTLT
jgi:hypothetical protein